MQKLQGSEKKLGFFFLAKPANILFKIFRKKTWMLSLPLFFDKELPYEVLGQVRRIKEELLVKGVVNGYNVCECFLLGVPQEGGGTRQP